MPRFKYDVDLDNLYYKSLPPQQIYNVVTRCYT